MSISFLLNLFHLPGLIPLRAHSMSTASDICFSLPSVSPAHRMFCFGLILVLCFWSTISMYLSDPFHTVGCLGGPDNAAFSPRYVEALVIATRFPCILSGFVSNVYKLHNFKQRGCASRILQVSNPQVQICRGFNFKAVKDQRSNPLNTSSRANYMSIDSSTPTFFVETAFPLHY
jgi:hypothetical protein